MKLKKWNGIRRKQGTVIDYDTCDNRNVSFVMQIAFGNFFRGNLLLGGGRFQIHPDDPEKTIVDYIVCLEFNGSDLAKPVLESVLSKMILQDAEFLREITEELKVR